jgi:hypothetical protein
MSVTTVERESTLAISREEAAHRLGLSLNSFERHVQPSLRTVKVGRRILIPVSALEVFLDGEAAS